MSDRLLERQLVEREHRHQRPPAHAAPRALRRWKLAPAAAPLEHESAHGAVDIIHLVLPPGTVAVLPKKWAGPACTTDPAVPSVASSVGRER
jgi:hypothetical protein